MGRLVLAGAISGLGEGLGKAAEQRGRMAQEAERTSREIALQRMRDKSAMERRSEQETGLSERLENRYGVGGFEETLGAVKHENTMKEIAERGKYQIKAAATGRAGDPTKVQTVEYTKYDDQGFPLGKDFAVVRNDAETGMALAQITKSGVTLDVPVSMLKEGAQGSPKSKEVGLWKSPHIWEQYERTYGELPPWFNTYFYMFKEGRGKRRKSEPTPRLGGDTQPVVAARGQVQRGGGGGTGTEPAPDLKERLLTRASEMQ